MVWKNLREEIEEMMGALSSFGPERREWVEQRRLRSLINTNYCERKRLNKEFTAYRRLEREDARRRYPPLSKPSSPPTLPDPPEKPPYCLYCFQYFTRKSNKKRYCCREHGSKAQSTCIPQWRLPDGGDVECSICQRRFKSSPHATSSEYCSSKCQLCADRKKEP